jgi:hypothetical protein
MILTNMDKNNLHALLKQQGELTQDGCWDAIEVFEKFLKEKHELEQPVAWMYDWNIKAEEEYGDTKYDALTRAESITNNRAITNVRPLYNLTTKHTA